MVSDMPECKQLEVGADETAAVLVVPGVLLGNCRVAALEEIVRSELAVLPPTAKSDSHVRSVQ